MIEVRDLFKRYGRTVAVDGISFSVDCGEIVGFLGPNGAGKTSTMRILSGFLPATSGLARIAGHDVFRDSLQARRHIGYLPEGVPLYPEMRTVEYLHYRASIKGVPRSERRRSVGEVMDRCRVASVSRKLIGALSKGFRQRVGLADALLGDPPVLILDEPTIGLDPNQVRELRALIRELEANHTVLLSTHILPEVEALCTRVIIIHNGRIAFEDTLDGIAHRGAGRTQVVVEIRAAAGETNPLGDVPGATLTETVPLGEFTRLRFSVRPDHDVREELFRRIVECGGVLRELRREQASLEDIFVHLTAGED